MKANRWRKRVLAALTVPLLASLGGDALAISCGDVIGPNVSVTLSSDLTCSTSPAITVVGPAEFNLGFNTITCANALGQSNQTGIGIQVDGRGAHVHSGEVRGCRGNVELNGVKVGKKWIGEHRVKSILSRDGDVGFGSWTELNRFEGNFSLYDVTGFRVMANRNHVQDNYAEGVVGASSRGFEINAVNTRVIGNTAREFEHGYYFGGSTDRVESNAAEDNQIGFRIASNLGTRLAGNIATNSDIGFDVGSTDGVQLYRNTAQDNDVGFSTTKGSENIIFENNTAVGNGFGFADNGFHSTFRFNTAVDNDLGFYVFKQAREAIVYDNLATANSSHGIALSGKATIASKNHSEKNGGIGIWVTQDFDSTIILNTSTGNALFDMKDLVPGCGSNVWTINTFGTSNQACIE